MQTTTKQATLLLIARSRITTVNERVIEKPNRLVCTCFAMMSFIFAPVAKDKPNLQNVFDFNDSPPSPPPPNNLGLQVYVCWLYFCWVLVYGVSQLLHGISDFAKVKNNVTRRKTIFPLQLRIYVKRRIVICSYTLDIKTTITTYHIKCPGSFMWSFWRIHGY